MSARAAVLAAPGRAEVTEVEMGELAPLDVRVAIEGCGICGSNLPLWEGRPWFDYPRPPGTPGHEGWGRIEEVGRDVDVSATGLRPGVRVAMVGDGAFAELMDVAASGAVILPSDLDGKDFPGEALGSVVNVAARCGFVPGQDVCIIGAGFIGTAVGALAAQAGCRVIAVSRRQWALELAARMGAAELVTYGEGSEVVAAVESLTNGELAQVVVEAVGSQGALDLAGKLTGVRGRLVIAGFHQESPRSVDVQLWNWRGIDVVNAHERQVPVVVDGIARAARALAEGQFDPGPLLTHRYRLDQLGQGLDDMVHRPDGFLKGLVII